MTSQIGMRLDLRAGQVEVLLQAVGDSKAINMCQIENDDERYETALAVYKSTRPVVDAVPNATKHLAVEAFVGTHEDLEGLLEVKTGDIIAVYSKQSEQGWWAGQIDDKRHGHFPAACVDADPLDTNGPAPTAVAANEQDANQGQDLSQHVSTSSLSAQAQVAKLKADLDREQQADDYEEALRSSGEWWDTQLDAQTWKRLLPRKPRVVKFSSKSTVDTEGVTTKSFSLSFEDSSTGVVTVKLGQGGAKITETYDEPAAARSALTLKGYSTRFCQPMVDFCTYKEGEVVGDGQCWTFVDQCLRNVKARPAYLYNFGQVIDEQRVATAVRCVGF